MKKKSYSVEIGGKTLTAEFTDLADQANGSVIIKYGNTVVLVTAVMSDKPKEGGGWFPLTVDYEERFYAAGQILGGQYTRREGRPSDEAILSGRIVDRTIRPLFDQYIRNEVQVVITVLSIDEDDPDMLALLGASLAVSTSDIPWNGPVSGIRVGKKKGSDELIINPTYAFRHSEEIEADIVVCGKDGKINMIEVGAQEIDEKTTKKIFALALAEVEKIQDFQKKIIKEIGAKKKIIEKPKLHDGIAPLFAENIQKKMPEYIFKGAGHEHIYEIKDEWVALTKEKLPDADPSQIEEYFEEKLSELIHEAAVEKEKRPDGRKLDEVRPLFVQAGQVSPVLHGTGIFYRGGTHVLSVLTLGGPGDSQIIDGMELQTKKRFMHHYNFPPFSSGETGRIGGTNRRMVGHGALAEKALAAVLPSKEKFPYTIRIVSESMASNGSTSMGSVCAGTLALMDAGVPIHAPVAGIASGLMLWKGKHKVLTDIQGPEDHHGDMDFKVAGTRNGITAIQMDVKVDGIHPEIIAEALLHAKSARERILDVIEKEIKTPRADISPNAPKIILVKIKPDQIGLVIGTGGKTINGIKEQTGAEIDIEDDGSVFITGKNGSAEKTAEIIRSMTKEFKPGEKAEGIVVKIAEFGAFVELNDSTDGLVHISEMAPWRVDRVESLVKVGDKVPVIVKEIDDRGRLKLSIKEVDPKFFESKQPKRP